MSAARAIRLNDTAPDAATERGDAERVELASAVFELLHELGSSENPVSRATASYLREASGYIEYIGEHANAQGEDFSRGVRLARRNKLLRELGRNSVPLAGELDKHAAGKSAAYWNTNPFPEYDRRHKLHEVLRLNKGRPIKERQLRNIL